MYLEVAIAASKRSTCYRRSVGAVLVQDKHIVALGYNGPPAGEPHCEGALCGGLNGCQRAIHAEANAFVHMAASAKPDTMYVTESPCEACAHLILRSPVKRLFFLNEYRDPSGLFTLYNSHRVAIFRITPSDFIVDYGTGEIVSGA